MHQQLPSIGPIHAQPVVWDTPSRHELAEDMAWAHLYRAVRQPPAAAEVVRYLDTSPEARSRHEALYLVACETLHAKTLADEQNERTVAFFRAIFVTAPIRTLQLVKSIFVGITKVFSSSPAADPQTNEPKGRVSRAKARVDALAKHPEVAQAMTGFPASSSSPPAAPEAPAADEAQASRNSKAA
jgi:hypothetical protein